MATGNIDSTATQTSINPAEAIMKTAVAADATKPRVQDKVAETANAELGSQSHSQEPDNAQQANDEVEDPEI
jgi:hypothetical protein